MWQAVVPYNTNSKYDSSHPGRPESPNKLIMISSYRMSTCGWCIGSLSRAFIVSVVKVDGLTPAPRWELPGNYPVFTVVMSIYHYIERIWRILVTPDFSYKKYDNEKYYPGEPVNIHIQSLINIIQENNRVITTKKE